MYYRASFSLLAAEEEHLSVFSIHPILLVAVATGHEKNALSLHLRDARDVQLTIDLGTATHHASRCDRIVVVLRL